jgi:hypothetical protein
MMPTDSSHVRERESNGFTEDKTMSSTVHPPTSESKDVAHAAVPDVADAECAASFAATSLAKVDGQLTSAIEQLTAMTTAANTMQTFRFMLYSSDSSS